MTDAANPQPRFAGYRLIKRLGGSAGRAVHLAEREGSRPVSCVLKKLEPRAGQVPVALLDGFCRQIDLMRRIDHPGIVKTLAHHLPAGHTHGIPGSFVCLACQAAQPNDASTMPYMVMELLPGASLERIARAQARGGQPLPPALGAYIVHELARALGYAHNLRDERGRLLGVLHGSLRPKEVMLLRGGEVKLLAFGGQGGETLPLFDGHPARGARLPGTYLAPEQLLSKPLDARVDVFALGAILWELLVGVPLFGATTENEALTKVLACEVPRPSSLNPQIPSGLDAIVTRALARDPSRRHPSADAFAEELARGLPPRSKLLMHTASLVASVRDPASQDREARRPSTGSRSGPRFRRTTPAPPPLPMPSRRLTPPPPPPPIESTALVARDRITQSPAPTETPSRPVPLPPPVRPPSLLFHLGRLALVAVVAFGGGVLWHQHRGSQVTTIGVAADRPVVVPLTMTAGSGGKLVKNPAAPEALAQEPAKKAAPTATAAEPRAKPRPARRFPGRRKPPSRLQALR
jgi:serine/threonine protein kinase